MSEPPVEVRAPAEQAEGTRSQVLRWLKALGEPVSEHEPLIELETDKVTVELAAPASGVLSEILKAERDEVIPGELLGRIAPLEHPAQHSGEPAGAAVPSAVAGAAGPGLPVAASPNVEPIRVSPAVRRLLAERGLTAAQVRGSGPGGRLTVDDVLGHPGAPTVVPAGGAVAAQVERLAGDGPAVRRVPHSAVRTRIAAHMVESLLHTAPHVTTVFEIDLAAVLEHRRRHREVLAGRGVSLTLTAYFVRAAVEAIRTVPEANSRWTDAALEVYEGVNFGIATAAPDGLVVPVLRCADALDLEQTARGIEELVRRARAGGLRPEDVRGGTFTLSNHGVSGSLLATPIILPCGQAAILGVGKLEKRAVVVANPGEDRIEIRPRCYATLTIDHRVMDGERANRFMQVFTQRLTGWTD